MGVRVFGLHLMPMIDLIESPRLSALIELGEDRSLLAVGMYRSVTDILQAVGPDPAIVATDAPLVVTNDEGRRDLEHLLHWCDVPVFPVSRRRLQTVFGGHRGGELLERTPRNMVLVETPPDLVLRQFMWHERRPQQPMDLGSYRTEWIGLRPPAFRPKGAGRARDAGIPLVHQLIGRHVDLAGWSPHASADDWQAIADAAVLDAVACAWVARNAVTTPEQTMRIGPKVAGHPLIVADDNLRHRLAVNADRLRSEGTITSDLARLTSAPTPLGDRGGS